MAKAKVFEGRVRITSTLTNEVIKKAQAFKPESLKVKEDGNTIFSVTSSHDVSGFSKHGVILIDGKATGDITQPMSSDDKYLLEGILSNLAIVEAQVGAVEYPKVELEEVN